MVVVCASVDVSAVAWRGAGGGSSGLGDEHERTRNPRSRIRRREISPDSPRHLSQRSEFALETAGPFPYALWEQREEEAARCRD